MSFQKPDIAQRDRSAMPDVVRRTLPAKVTARMEDGEDGEKQPVIFGHAAKINQPYLLYKWSDGEEWWETLAPGFFDDVLDDDVRCLKNHDSNLVLGRTKSGTSDFSIDKEGLYYECRPDMRIGYAADAVYSVERGDIDQCSFAFTVKKRSWTEEEMPDGNLKVTFTLEKCSRLYDYGPVTYPANEDTSVGVRSADMVALRKELMEARAQKKNEQAPAQMPLAQRQRHLRLLEIA